jgi:hypothetical protein
VGFGSLTFFILLWCMEKIEIVRTEYQGFSLKFDHYIDGNLIMSSEVGDCYIQVYCWSETRPDNIRFIAKFNLKSIKK